MSGSPKASSAEVMPLIESLESRHANVTKLTQQYYRGDVVPPSTKSQALRAQKFSVMYYYGANMVFFFYSFLIPLHQSEPYYGYELRKIQANSAHLTIMALVLIMVMVRFLVMSWTAQFYHFAIMLTCFELAFVFFTIMWWSAGLPVLLILLISNLLNIVVSQLYWKARFFEVVKDLPMLVPPAPIPVSDSTALTLNFKQLVADFRKLWGFDQFKTEGMLYDERCGVFSSKDQISHAQALHCAYMQAIDPQGTYAMWKYDDALTTNHLSCLGLWEGLLRTFISNAFYSCTGFWLGKALFASFNQGWYAIGLGVIAFATFSISVSRTYKWLDESLGVAVAEKEWLAHDVVKHAAQREELQLEAMDTHVGGVALASSGVDMYATGRHNLVFMWICAAATANFVGESYLSRIYENVAIQTRLMMEATMQKEFRHYAEAKWEVVAKGSLVKSFQTFILALTCCLYFGSSYPNPEEMPEQIVALLGAAAFVQSVVSLAEGVHLAALILGKKATHRHSWISEWVVAITVLFILTNMLVWLYLLPIMKYWDLPVGGCKLDFNRELFPSTCPRAR